MVDKHLQEILSLDVDELWDEHRPVAAQFNKVVELNVPGDTLNNIRHNVIISLTEFYI